MTELIVYLKTPVPGQVKTRLQTRYTPEQAADLYRAFIRDTIDTVRSIDADRRTIAYAGTREDVDDLVPEGWTAVPQIEGDLGDRMLASLRSAVENGADRAVLIGTDIPSLPRDHLLAALGRLEQADVVLGPTTDGGFYLIGTRRTLPDIFPDVIWSTGTVFEKTSAAIRAHGLELALIPPWDDIDTPADLERVLRADRDGLTHTRAAVKRLPNPKV